MAKHISNRITLWVVVATVTPIAAPIALGDLALTSPAPDGLSSPYGDLGMHIWSIDGVGEQPPQWCSDPVDAWRGLSLDGLSVIFNGTVYAHSPIGVRDDQLAPGFLEDIEFSLGLRGNLGFAGLDGDSSPTGNRNNARQSILDGNAANETVVRPPTDNSLIGGYRSDQTPGSSAATLSDFRDTRGSGIWDPTLGDGEILVPRRERPPQVPSPSAVALGLLGLCLAVGVWRRLR